MTVVELRDYMNELIANNLDHLLVIDDADWEYTPTGVVVDDLEVATDPWHHVKIPVVKLKFDRHERLDHTDYEFVAEGKIYEND